MKLFHGSIRKKLVVLVLLATAPVFLVLLGTEFFHGRHAVKSAEKDIASFLNAFVEVQQRITDSTGTLLRTVASIPDIRNGDVEKSRVILSTLLETNPLYTNAILVDLEGNVVAAGRNHDRAGHLNFADRKQFREAIASRGFASGEFVVGKSSKKAIFPFGMAVPGESGKPRGALIIGVDLSHYREVFKRGTYSENSFFGLTDHKGLRLFRYPLPEKVSLGKPIKGKVFQAAEAAVGPGSIVTVASDGRKRIIVFEPLSLREGAPPYMYMFIGSDYEQIREKAHTVLTRVIVTGLFSLALALLIAWFIGGRSIAKRLEKLAAMTRKFGRGEKNVTGSLDYSDGELGNLSESFDNMVLTMRKREDERNDALEQFLASEQRFRKLIEGVSEISIQGYDENRNVTFWNYSSETLYGYKREEALGKKLEDLIIPDRMRDEVVGAHSNWLKGGEKIPAGEILLRDKWGNGVSVFSSHVMHDTPLGREMFCIDVDLTPLKRSEAERKQLLNQLRQSQKMEAIGTLAGGIAHDFNNILSIILGYSDILRTDLVGRGAKPREIDHIIKAGNRAKDLVGQILAFSRQNKEELLPIQPALIIGEAMKMLRASIPSTIRIHDNIPKCGSITGDPTRFHQIVMNLCTNAYHAMRETGGTLGITLLPVTLEKNAPEVLSSPLTPGPYLKLEISDTGHGMDRELRQKIFDPYFTTKKKGEGTGLGLAVVHGIVKNFGGHIALRSEPGRGTTFSLYFPHIDFEAKEGPVAPAEALPTGDEHLLVVDDEESIVQMEKLMLETLGYRVSACTSSPEALQLFQERPERFAAVITDVTMPDMSGVELVQRIREAAPDKPVIVCSGFSELIDEQKAKALGIRKYLMKPILKRDLAVAVRDILDKDTA